jgi:hypothetical protein
LVSLLIDRGPYLREVLEAAEWQVQASINLPNLKYVPHFHFQPEDPGLDGGEARGDAPGLDGGGAPYTPTRPAPPPLSPLRAESDYPRSPRSPSYSPSSPSYNPTSPEYTPVDTL